MKNNMVIVWDNDRREESIFDSYAQAWDYFNPMVKNGYIAAVSPSITIKIAERISD